MGRFKHVRSKTIQSSTNSTSCAPFTMTWTRGTNIIYCFQNIGTMPVWLRMATLWLFKWFIWHRNTVLGQSHPTSSCIGFRVDCRCIMKRRRHSFRSFPTVLKLRPRTTSVRATKERKQPNLLEAWSVTTNLLFHDRHGCLVFTQTNKHERAQ